MKRGLKDEKIIRKYWQIFDETEIKRGCKKINSTNEK